MISGEVITAIGMTEPGTGSDLQGIRTVAADQGDHYLVNGAKTFITNGYLCDMAIVVVKTNAGTPKEGISLLMIDTTLEGFSKGKPFKKVGMKAQDTCELFFDDVKVPKDRLLGEEGAGFIYLMQELAQERLLVGVVAVAVAEEALKRTIEYTKERMAFGKPISAFQNTQFKLAELATEIQMQRVFIDKCLELHIEKKLDATTASMAKYAASDLQCKVVDECVQLHGGYGYMWEYFIARAYADARVQRIYAGTNEIMKIIISRDILGISKF